LQANRKTREGAAHPDRDAQFAHINATTEAYLGAGAPVIAVDTTKQERVGDFTTGGRDWRPPGEPEEVRVPDCVRPALGRASPDGVDDRAAHAGGVSVGIDHETAACAVASSGRWWERTGRRRYGAARRLWITADGGGSNGSRLRRWKWEVQRLADTTGLAITVCHLPPGTSTWNTIEHRRFSCISQTWRGKPPVRDAVILSLSAANTTGTGLSVESELDTQRYPAGLKISDAQMAPLRLERDAFHGAWTYTILPHSA
jgi:hypothetical protein